MSSAGNRRAFCRSSLGNMWNVEMWDLWGKGSRNGCKEGRRQRLLVI